MTSVIICDDHRRLREGLRRHVAAVPGVIKVDIAESAEELLARYPAERHGLILMSVRLPGMGGLEGTRRLVAQFPDANVVMLAGEGDRDSVAAAIMSGARGFLQRDVAREELCAAVAHALADPIIRMEVPRPREDLMPLPELSERELQVLRGMSDGKSNGQIGRELFLSEDTVKTHARRLFRKLGVNDRAQAVALGFRHGLVR
jgi:DNA-binding NarL/FixJ family response regulator